MPLITIPALPPQIFKITPVVEVRERLESRSNRDFLTSKPDNRTDLHSRWRVGAKMVEKNLKAEIQFQYSHTSTRASAGNFTDESSDLSLAYFDVPFESGSLTIGRQRFAYGNARLLGSPDWGNVPRSFDGIRYKSPNWEAFAFRLGVGLPLPEHQRFFGAGYSKGAWALYALQKLDDTAAGRVSLTTLNPLYKTNSSGFAIDVEGAFQFGRSAGKDHRAWMLHANATRKLDQQTQVWVEANAASGGSSASRSLTFDQILASNHNKYGFMDMQGLRNMNHLAIGMNRVLAKGLDAKLALHTFSLRDPADGWYGAGGSLNTGFIDPAGASGTDVGRELNLELNWVPKPNWSVIGGLGLFFPGGFIKSRNGGSADTQTWVYVGVAAKW